MVIILEQTYVDCLARFGVGGAHPGGLRLTKKILSKEAIDHTKFILDAGCGTGQTAAYIAEHYGCQVTSLDYNEMMVEKAMQRFQRLNLPIKVIQGRTEHLPFENASFDIVLSESVIAFTNLFLTITEFKRVLHQNGLLIAIEMVQEKSLSKDELEEITRFYGIPRLLSEDEWYNAFQHAGFKQIHVELGELQFDENDVNNVPDFSISEKINDTLFEILNEHQRLTKKYKEKLGYRIFRCFV